MIEGGPSLADWTAAAPRLVLRKIGAELVGPCPACGGSDRFRVMPSGAAFCRTCCPDGRDVRSFGRIVVAAGLPWPEPGTGSERRTSTAGRTSTASSPSTRTTPTAPATRTAPAPATAEVARKIWDFAGEADPAGLVGAYLSAGRGVWPPNRPFPADLRWIGSPAVRRLGLQHWPRDAVGAIVYGFRAPGGGHVAGVQLEPLGPDGRRRRWTMTKPAARKSFGTMRAGVFRVDGPADRALAICEGPADALAIRTWAGGAALAVGGTSGLLPIAPWIVSTGREATIWADGDAAGRVHATDLREAVLASDGRARVRRCVSGFDPADELAADLFERAAIRQFDGGQSAGDALAGAYTDLLG